MVRTAIAPAYLALCLVLGGSVQGIWANALLQVIAVAIIAWAAIERRATPLTRPARHLAALVTLCLLLVALQLLPLPEALWSALPGRRMVVDGFVLLGVAPGWLPLSLAPYDTLATLNTLLPPLAMLAAIIWLGSSRSVLLALAMLAVVVIAVLLGALQVAGPADVGSPFYFYRHSNFGVATGFFANGNHMATLLLAAIPFVAAWGATVHERSADASKRMAAIVIALGGLVVILAGLAINGSLAGYGLVLPVTIATGLVIARPRQRWVRQAALAVGIAAVVGLALVTASPLSERLMSPGASTSVSTRQTMLVHSSEAISTFGVAGSGLGTFAKVYRMFESDISSDRSYVNHAHNDYVELVLEMGLAGAVIIVLFLLWWGARAVTVVRRGTYDHFAAAAVIASATVLIHSAVDFPLRTTAISVLFATCLALLVVAKRKVSGANDLRPARHVVIR